MFNPINAVLPYDPPKEEGLLEAKTLDVAYDSLMTSFLDMIKSSQEDWIATQKQMFRKLKNEYSDTDDYAYRIITTKYETFSDSIFGFLQDKAIDTMKLLYKHTTNSDQQVRTIKAFLKHDPALGRRCYPNNGRIGFKTIPLPSEKELASAFSGFSQAWSNMEPLQASIELKKLPEWFSSEGSVLQKMDDELEVSFEEGAEYPIKEYVDGYEPFKQDLRKMLADTKQRVASIKSFVGKIHARNAANYKAYIKQLHSLNLTKEEKDSLVSIAVHNYSILSQIYMSIVNGCSYYSAHLYSFMFGSCANYKDIIQTIYGALYDEKEDTRHAIIS